MVPSGSGDYPCQLCGAEFLCECDEGAALLRQAAEQAPGQPVNEEDRDGEVGKSPQKKSEKKKGSDAAAAESPQKKGKPETTTWEVAGVKMMVLAKGGKECEAACVTITCGEETRETYVRTLIGKELSPKFKGGRLEPIAFSSNKNSHLLEALKRPINDTVNGRPVVVWETNAQFGGRTDGVGGSLAILHLQWGGTATPIDKYRAAQAQVVPLPPAPAQDSPAVPLTAGQIRDFLLNMPKKLRYKKPARLTLAKELLQEREQALGNEDFFKWLLDLSPFIDHNWFYGCLNHEMLEEVEKYLKDQKTGAFIVYFSEGRPGGLTITYLTSQKTLDRKRVNTYQDVLNVLKELRTDPPKGVSRFNTLYIYEGQED